MRICFVADARSPIARNWIGYFVDQGHDVHVISSYPYTGTPWPRARVHVVPLAFSGVLRMHALTHNSPPGAATPTSSRLSGIILSRIYPLLRRARYRLAPLEVWRHVRAVRRLVNDIQPDLVHAMRIPYEGVLAALAVRDVPLLISVWGNDFTLHAERNRILAVLTRHALHRVDALHCDCFRDLRLARDFGFDASKPSIVLPGAGGIHTSIFHPGPSEHGGTDLPDVPAGVPVIINPRGFRQYVRNDVFWRAIPLVLQRYPTTVFLCSGMQGREPAETYVRELDLKASVRLLPMMPHAAMADAFRLADIAVSPSEHDGTPNTLLEAMACGCFPVAGDIESIREWITPGVNGLLCDPGDPRALADVLLHAIEHPELRETAAPINIALVAERADYQSVMPQAAAMYEEVIRSGGEGRNAIVRTDRMSRAGSWLDVALFGGLEEGQASRVRALFDRKATSWSAKYGSSGRLTGRISAFASAVHACAEPPARILDLGCGTGEMACALSNDHYSVVACDVSPAMMELARRQNAPIDCSVQWVDLDQDWMRLPFAAESFEVVIASSVLEYIADLETCLTEVRRVLTASGVFLATVPNPEHPQRKLETVVAHVGLSPLGTVVRQLSPRLDDYITYLEVSRNRLSARAWAELAAGVGLQVSYGPAAQDVSAPSLLMLRFEAAAPLSGRRETT